MKVWPIFRKVVQVIGGGPPPDQNFRSTQRPAIRLETTLSGRVETDPAVALAEAPATLLTSEAPALDLDASASGTAGQAPANPALDLDASATGSAQVQALTGLLLTSLVSGIVDPFVNPGLDIDTSVSGTVVPVAVNPAQVLSPVNSGSPAKPDQTPAMNMVRVQYDLTHLSGATVATNTGADAWTNPNDALGIHGP